MPGDNSIPKVQKFEYYVPCGLAHPGLCAQQHPEVLLHAKLCAKNLYKAANEEGLLGEFVHLRVCAAGWSRDFWAAMSHTRGSGPRLLMVGPCAVDVPSGSLTVGLISQMHDFMPAVSLFGAVLRRAPSFDGLEVPTVREHALGPNRFTYTIPPDFMDGAVIGPCC